MRDPIFGCELATGRLDREGYAQLFDARLPERFWDKVMPEPNSGCWLWTGSTLPPWHYGRLSYRGRYDLAHRIAYHELVGPIPDGLELDHRCKNPTCCNPAHLEAVTHLENVRRSDSGKHNAIKTHCAQGHAFDEHNTIVRTRKSHGFLVRDCRECKNESNRQYRRRRRA